MSQDKRGIDLHIELLDSEVETLTATLAAKKKALDDAKKLDKAAYDLGYKAGFEAGQATKKSKGSKGTGTRTRLTKEQQEALEEDALSILVRGTPVKAEAFKSLFMGARFASESRYTATVNKLIKAKKIVKKGELTNTTYELAK